MFGKSIKLADILGIRVQVHWSFLLLIGWVLFSSLVATGDLGASFVKTSFVLVLFTCVVLHEFGHALAARMYGIPTRDITLLPIGGVARLARMPKNPWHEIVVALAGPAVNVVIAIVLWIAIGPISGEASWLAIATGDGGFWERILFVNLMLVAFNLLPAFPMDGGRVLRSTLALFFDYVPATRMAAAIGQTCAVGFGILGLFGNPMLLLLAAFIFFAAAGEANQVQLHDQLRGWKVVDATNRDFRAVSAEAPAAVTAMAVIHHPQRAFPVIDDSRFVGMVSREDLIKSLNQQDRVRVGDLPRTLPATVNAADDLEESFQVASTDGHDLLAVISDGELIGLLDLRTVVQVVRAQAQFRNQAHRPRNYFKTCLSQYPIPFSSSENRRIANC